MRKIRKLLALIMTIVMLFIVLGVIQFSAVGSENVSRTTIEGAILSEVSTVVREQQAEMEIWVNAPSNVPIGGTFNATVYVAGLPGRIPIALSGIEFMLQWDNSVVNFVGSNAGLPFVGSAFDGFWHGMWFTMPGTTINPANPVMTFTFRVVGFGDASINVASCASGGRAVTYVAITSVLTSGAMVNNRQITANDEENVTIDSAKMVTMATVPGVTVNTAFLYRIDDNYIYYEAALLPGGILRVETRIDNASGTTINPIVMIAAFNAGVFIGSQIAPLQTVPNNTNRLFIAEYPVSTIGINEIRVLVMDRITMRPYVDRIILTPDNVTFRQITVNVGDYVSIPIISRNFSSTAEYSVLFNPTDFVLVNAQEQSNISILTAPQTVGGVQFTRIYPSQGAVSFVRTSNVVNIVRLRAIRTTPSGQQFSIVIIKQ